MRAWVVVLTAMLAACRPAARLEPHTRSARLRVTFVAETDSFQSAAKEYDSLWKSEGARITDALEHAAGLRLVDIGDTDVVAIVFEGVSNSGYRDTPMHLRASYPTATKKATLMHELGHRLESELFHGSENDHPYLFLWLYPAWVSSYGEDFAREQVVVEKRRGGVYPAAWDAALALTPRDRAARWDSVRASRTRR
jgi:hypothetical protein